MSRDKAEIIAYAIRKECQKCNWYETWGITFDEFEEFLSNGIKGIEKQIPKKPKTDDRYVMYICPWCNDFVKVSHNYCQNCGQKLDWGDGE